MRIVWHQSAFHCVKLLVLFIVFNLFLLIICFSAALWEPWCFPWFCYTNKVDLIGPELQYLSNMKWCSHPWSLSELQQGFDHVVVTCLCHHSASKPPSVWSNTVYLVDRHCRSAPVARVSVRRSLCYPPRSRATFCSLTKHRSNESHDSPPE